MIRRITDVHSDVARVVFGLRQQFLTTHAHELWTPMEQLVPGVAQGLFLLLSLELTDGVPVGFAMLHSYHWGNVPVLWLDEVYIEPASRRQGLFEQFVTWCGQYCQVSGVPTMMTNVWTKAEGAPFSKHVGAEPVVLTLKMIHPSYVATSQEERHEQHPDPDTSGNGEQKVAKKKPRVARRLRAVSDRPRDSARVPSKVGE